MTNFPTDLDTFSNPSPSTLMNDSAHLHDAQHTNLNDAMLAVQTKIGIDGSTDPNCLTFQLAALVALTFVAPLVRSSNSVSIPKATASVNGYLASADFAIFTAKQAALTFGNLTEITSNILTITGGTGAVIGTGASIRVKQAGSAQSGYVSQADWTTFNGKESVLTFSAPLARSVNTVSIPAATSSVNGYLTSADWTTFNSKQATLTLGNLTEATSAVLTITGGTGAIIGSGLTIQVKAAATAQSGYLSFADWNTFNGKENALTFSAPLSRTSNTISIPKATTSVDGYLSHTDWTTFNNKLSAFTPGDLTEATSSVLTITGGAGSAVANVSIQVKKSTASVDGYLAAADFTTFNGKENVLTFSAPLVRSTNTISIPAASSSVNGYLSSTDWSTFNNKQATLTLGNLTEATSSVLTIAGGSGAIIGSGLTVQVKVASGSQPGYLASADWTTFNNKESVLTFSAPLSRTSNTISIPVATSSVNGYLAAADWVNFTGKVNKAGDTMTGDLVMSAGANLQVNLGAVVTVFGVGSLSMTSTSASHISPAYSYIGWADNSGNFLQFRDDGTIALSAGGTNAVVVDSSANITGSASIALTPAANRTALTTTGYSITGSNAQPMIDLAGTWNTTGTPAAIRLNITDTASNNNSLLVDLQVNSGSVFSIDRDGNIRTSASNTIAILGTNNISTSFEFTPDGATGSATFTIRSDDSLGNGDCMIRLREVNDGDNAQIVGGHAGGPCYLRFFVNPVNGAVGSSMYNVLELTVGGVEVMQGLTVDGGTTCNNWLYVAGDLTMAGVSGDAHIVGPNSQTITLASDGSLIISGDLSSSAIQINSNGSISINQAVTGSNISLSVDGSMTFSFTDVSGSINKEITYDAAGNLTVGSADFTVNCSSGNLSLNGDGVSLSMSSDQMDLATAGGGMHLVGSGRWTFDLPPVLPRAYSAGTSSTFSYNTDAVDETYHRTSSTTLASLTLTLPTTTVKGQILRVFTQSTITSVTMAGMNSLTPGLTSMTAGQAAEFMAIDASGNYIRIR